MFFLGSQGVSGLAISDPVAKATQLDQILYFQLPYRQLLPLYCSFEESYSNGFKKTGSIYGI